MALSVLVISGSAALYAFSMRRASQDAGKAQVMAQAQAVLEDISRTVRQSVGCDTFTLTNSGTFNGATALRCAMPLTMVDTDGAAGPDSYLADQVNEGGAEVYLPGSYIFYVWLAAGWGGDPQKRMVRITQNSPDPLLFTDNLATWDPVFTFSSANDEKFRFDRLTSVTFQVDSQGRSVLTSISGSANGFNQSGAWGNQPGDENNIRSTTLARRIGWINELDSREQGTGPNLLINGDFAGNTLAGWIAQNMTSSGLSTAYSVADGSFYSIQMNWGNDVGSMVLSQEVSLPQDEDYVLSFSLGLYSLSPSGDKACSIKIEIIDTESGEKLVEKVLNDWSSGPAGPTFWTDYSIPFRAVNQSHRIVFTDQTDLSSSANRDPFLAKIALRRLN